MAARPSSGSPAWHSAKTMTGLPCTSSGRNGSGGACRRTDHTAVSSVKPAAILRNFLSASLACSRGYTTSPLSSSGPTSWSRNSNSVTTPKLPPPPRSAQKRSGCSLLAHPQDLPVGGHDLGPDQVVRGQAVLPAQPAEAAAEGESGDAGGGVDPGGRGQSMLCRLAVDVPERGSRSDRRGLCPGIDPDEVHEREVDHQPVVADRIAGDVVAAALDRQQKPLISREIDGVLDIGGALATRDQSRTPVDHGVPDGACIVVAVVRRTQQHALHRSRERVHCPRPERPCALVPSRLCLCHDRSSHFRTPSRLRGVSKRTHGADSRPPVRRPIPQTDSR